MNQPLLEGRNIRMVYHGETILQDIQIALASGESLAVVGPSGSGKTTLLSIMGLLLAPTGGETYFQGRKTSDLPDDQRSRLRNRHFGFVFQNSQLINTLTVLDNVLVPARFAGMNKAKEKQAVSLLEELGLGERIQYLPHQLSIGQKRRVAIARALIMDPQVVFADEPTNDLDVRRAEQVAQLLLDLPKRGISLMMVTHDPGLAQRAHRVFNLVERG